MPPSRALEAVRLADHDRALAARAGRSRPARPSLSMFQMMRPGCGLRPVTWSCGPTVNEPTAQLPDRVAAVSPHGLTEQLRVVVGQALRVLRPDEDAVEVHSSPPFANWIDTGRSARCRGACSAERSATEAEEGWRARRDSNPRPSAPEADALSTELRAQRPRSARALTRTGWPARLTDSSRAHRSRGTFRHRPPVTPAPGTGRVGGDAPASLSTGAADAGIVLRCRSDASLQDA